MYRTDLVNHSTDIAQSQRTCCAQGTNQLSESIGRAANKPRCGLRGSNGEAPRGNIAFPAHLKLRPDARANAQLDRAGCFRVWTLLTDANTIAHHAGNLMARRTYREIEAVDRNGWSEWIYPTPVGHRLACCDCGLVHEVDFRVEDGRAEYRMRRDRRSTAGMSRKT